MKLCFKRIIALILVFSMAFCFGACGEKESEHPDFIYEASFKDLDADFDDGFSVLCTTSDGLYVQTTTYIETATDTNEYEKHLYLVSYSGEITELDAYKPIEFESTHQDARSYYFDSYIEHFLETADGENLISIETVYENWNDAPKSIPADDERYWDYSHYESHSVVRVIDKTGAEISTANVEVPEDDEDFYFGTIVADKNNTIITTCDNAVIGLNIEGNRLFKTEISADYTKYIHSLIPLKSGSVAACISNETGSIISTIDENGKLGDEFEFNYSAYKFYKGSGDYDFYFSTSLNMYGYKLESNSADELFSWFDLSIDPDNIQSVSCTEDGSVYAFSQEYNETTWDVEYELISLTKKPYSETDERKELTFACYYLGWDVKNAIMDFNKNNTEYKISIIDYSEGASDYESGIMKFNTELISGNVPDIIDLGDLNMARLASAGILEDLYPYIEKDSELKKENYFQNILQAMEIDGKLYTTLTSMSIISLIGASKLVGTEPGWTYEDLYEALSKMPEGCEIMDQGVTKDNILQIMLFLNMNDFVDWTTGKCNFNSKEFIDLLKFTEYFPLEFDYSSEESYYEDSATRIQQGKQMLAEYYVSSLYDLVWNSYEDTFGGDVTCIGFPSNDKNGSVVYINSGYGISAASKNKDAAWQFIRQFMTDEYVLEDEYSLPVSKTAYNTIVDKLTHIQYQTDYETGEYILDENGEKIPQQIGGYWDSTKGEYISMYTVPQERIDHITEMITSATKIANTDQEILAIVEDQVEAFFNGTSSAEKVAEAIQNKAEIYINEQR